MLHAYYYTRASPRAVISIVEIGPGMAGKIWNFCHDIRKKSWTDLVKFEASCSCHPASSMPEALPRTDFIVYMTGESIS